MPVRQQYFIATAIIGLIGVMVAFAMFDYFSDRSRFAERMALPAQGAVVPVGMSYSGAVNAAGFGNYLCGNCGWQGTSAWNGVCPNCRAFLCNPNAGVVPMNGQNAAFTWFNQQAAVPAPPRGVLYCPVCDFAITSKHKAVPNSIRCPRCPAYLVTSDMVTGAAAGSANTAQQAAWRLNCPPAYNPACPIPGR